MNYLKIGDKEVRVTNLDKVYDDKNNISKKDCINYYIKVFPYIKPFIENRPVSLKRFPNGFNDKGFYQKNVDETFPKWIQVVEKKGLEKYPLINNIETFIYLTNLGTIEFHPWMSTIHDLEAPEYGVFDIDPMKRFTFKEVIKVAKTIYSVLELLKLKSAAKLSGSTGIQIYLPVKDGYSYERVRELVRKISVVVNNKLSDTTTLVRKRELRSEKIYLDFLQNVKGQTIVAPFSIRPKPKAPISVPVCWDKMLKSDTVNSAQHYNINNIDLQEIKEGHHLFMEILSQKQEIEPAENILSKILK
ncbi:non-homologous end-joining DNA ligase [Proteinivorax hydrogeniformans]|uniref:Non-homologous end-joining DNA ligase n=1 Tax=Proteinivorax hydrogeniformans TaxID=1826727 RepID=A0AAU8HTL2_9FIRM